MKDRCSSKSKHTGGQCKQSAEPGWKVCRFHGAYGGRPPIHGRYSKALNSTNLSEAYRAAIEDQSLLDLKEPLALLEACLQRTSERVALADTPEFRKRAYDKYQEIRDRLRSGDQSSASALLIELGDLLRDGVEEDRAVSELSVQAERLAKRVEAVWQIRLTRKQVFNIQQLGVLIGRVLQIVKEEATPEIAAHIVSRMETQVLKLPEAQSLSGSERTTTEL